MRPGCKICHRWSASCGAVRTQAQYTGDALPIKPRGMFGPRPFLFLPPFPLPLPVVGAVAGLTGVLDLVRLDGWVAGFGAGFSGCMAMVEGGNSLQGELTLCWFLLQAGEFHVHPFSGWWAFQQCGAMLLDPPSTTVEVKLVSIQEVPACANGQRALHDRSS